MAPPLTALREVLVDVAQPMGRRTHAAFYLRTHAQKEEAVDAIAEALRNRDDSALLRHELAYILGQMGETRAIGVLTEVLNDGADDIMVRHEAAEALGAIGDSGCVGVLEKHTHDTPPEVADTCKLALDLIRWRQSSEANTPLEKNPYLSVDPAPADKKDRPVAELREKLLDPSLPLFERYRAMFSLRNRGTEEAVLALADGFGDASALFRHEVAYVMGQLQHPASVPSLKKILEDVGEHRMVRHEAAEALGAVGGKECEELLQRFAEDTEVVVRESCEVGLSTMEYWEELDKGGQ